MSILSGTSDDMPMFERNYEYEIKAYNEAIEAAAMKAEACGAILVALQIRGLKK